MYTHIIHIYIYIYIYIYISERPGGRSRASGRGARGAGCASGGRRWPV